MIPAKSAATATMNLTTEDKVREQTHQVHRTILLEGFRTNIAELCVVITLSSVHDSAELGGKYYPQGRRNGHEMNNRKPSIARKGRHQQIQTCSRTVKRNVLTAP